MVTTTNKGIEKPVYQEYSVDPTGWTDPINANWDVIDSAFGGTHAPAALTSSSSDITLTANQCRNARIKLTGTAATAKTINVFFPAGIAGMFIIDNATSGPFTINLKSAAVGATEFIEATQNANTFMWLSSDAGSEGTYLADNSPLTAGAGITVTGTTVALQVPVTTARGGTGATSYTAGQLLIGNTAGGLTPANLTAGSNITITNGNGTITIGASGSAGGVTTFRTSLSGLSPSVDTAGAVTLSGTLGIANGGTGATSATGARTALGLGTMATQAASNVAITGGTITLSTAATFSKVTASTGGTNGFVVGTSGVASVSGVGNVNLDTNTSFYGSDSTNVTHAFNSIPVWVSNTTSFTLGSGISAFKDGGGSWSATSDSRVKKDVVNYPLSMKDLGGLRPVSYQYNGQYGTKADGKTYIGLIAQEVQGTAFASMVGSYVKDGVELLNLDSSQLVFALVNAVKELDARVKALEAKTA